jgi:hypothetical protein
MTCTHITTKDIPCGRPAVAVWRHPVLGQWPLCHLCDHRAIQAGVEGWLRIAELPATFGDPLTLAEVAA